MLLRLLLVSVCSAVTATISALEAVGKAPCLKNRYRAEWRSTPLAAVLKELEKQSAPLALSVGIEPLKDKCMNRQNPTQMYPANAQAHHAAVIAASTSMV